MSATPFDSERIDQEIKELYTTGEAGELIRSEAKMYLTESREKRPDPPGSSARARLESVTRVRGLVETAHNYLGRTPGPTQAQWLAQTGEATMPIKEQALDAFDALERILVRWQSFEQDKLT